MKNFGAVFQQCLDNQNISINQLARNLEFNRGWLYNVFAGRKTMSEEKFLRLLNTVEFTPKNAELLREAYYSAVYGIQAYKRILTIKRLLAEEADNKPPCGPITEKELTPPDSFALVDEESLSGVLRYILKKEFTGSDVPVVYTNYPYGLKHIDEMVYCASSGCGKETNFNRILTFERNPKGSYNLDNVLKSLKYLKLRHHVWYHYADSVPEPRLDTVFPYFFITSSSVLLFDSLCKTNLFLGDETMAKDFRRKAEGFIENCEALAVYPESILELKDLMEPNLLKGEYMIIQRSPCWAAYINREVLENIIAKDLPFRDAYIQIAERYYSDLFSKRFTHIVSLSGAAEFTASGRLYEAPEAIVPILTPAMKAYMLESLLKEVETEPAQIRFIDENTARIPNVEISYCETVVNIIGVVSQGPEGYMGEYFLSLKDRHIAADFRNFRDYITRNGFFCEPQYVINTLKDLLSVCKNGEQPEKAAGRQVSMKE